MDKVCLTLYDISFTDRAIAESVLDTLIDFAKTSKDKFVSFKKYLELSGENADLFYTDGNGMYYFDFDEVGWIPEDLKNVRVYCKIIKNSYPPMKYDGYIINLPMFHDKSFAPIQVHGQLIDTDALYDSLAYKENNELTATSIGLTKMGVPYNSGDRYKNHFKKENKTMANTTTNMNCTFTPANDYKAKDETTLKYEAERKKLIDEAEKKIQKIRDDVALKLEILERDKRLTHIKDVEAEQAQYWKAKYDALLTAGFTEEQAWQMCMKSFEMD